MTDTSNSTLNWTTAPDQFRSAFESNKQQLEEANAGLAERDRLARENVMLRAGVDPSHPAAAVFTNGYDGKLDVDDVKAAWAAIAGTPAPAPTTTAPPPNDDGSDPAVVAQLTDLQAQRDQLGSGGTPPGDEPTADPQTAMIQDFHADRARGRNREQAMNKGLNTLFTAAAEGDPRVTSDSYEGSMRNYRQKNEFE